MAWLIQYRSGISQRLSLPNMYRERTNEGTNHLTYVKQLLGDTLSRLEYRASPGSKIDGRAHEECGAHMGFPLSAHMGRRTYVAHMAELSHSHLVPTCPFPLTPYGQTLHCPCRDHIAPIWGYSPVFYGIIVICPGLGGPFFFCI